MLLRANGLSTRSSSSRRYARKGSITPDGEITVLETARASERFEEVGVNVIDGKAIYKYDTTSIGRGRILTSDSRSVIVR